MNVLSGGFTALVREFWWPVARRASSGPSFPSLSLQTGRHRSTHAPTRIPISPSESSVAKDGEVTGKQGDPSSQPVIRNCYSLFTIHGFIISNDGITAQSWCHIHQDHPEERSASQPVPLCQSETAERTVLAPCVFFDINEGENYFTFVKFHLMLLWRQFKKGFCYF